MSRLTGCHVETIRYYERIGLLPAPPRSEGGHRLYGQTHVQTLAFIRRARDLGFTIEQVRSLVRLVQGGRYTCGEIRELALAHLTEVRTKLRELRRLERTLAGAVSRCDGGDAPHCPVVEVLGPDDRRQGAMRTHAPQAGGPTTQV